MAAFSASARLTGTSRRGGPRRRRRRNTPSRTCRTCRQRRTRGSLRTRSCGLSFVVGDPAGHSRDAGQHGDEPAVVAVVDEVAAVVAHHMQWGAVTGLFVDVPGDVGERDALLAWDEREWGEPG